MDGFCGIVMNKEFSYLKTFVCFMQLRQLLCPMRIAWRLLSRITIKKTTLVDKPTLTSLLMDKLESGIEYLGSWTEGGIVDTVDEVYREKTPVFQTKIASTPIKKPTIKLVLSSEDSEGRTNVVLETAKPGFPLRTVNADSGREIQRLVKSQVYLSTLEGELAGMGTLVDTPEGVGILTLGHVLKACLAGHDSLVISSATNDRGEKLTRPRPRRITSFMVGNKKDYRVLLEAPRELRSRLGLKAAPMTELFKSGCGLVYSPPESTGKQTRFSTGRLNSVGAGGLITFAGSTVPGTSGAGVFLGGKLVSVHIGTLKEENENVSFWNLPRGGKPVSKTARLGWALSQGVSLESAIPTPTIFNLTDFVDIFAEESYEMEDVDLDGDDEEGRYTRYDALGDEYAEATMRRLVKDESAYDMMASMLTTNTFTWGGYESDDDDQDYLQDLHEARGTVSEGNVGRRGVYKPAARTSVRLETAVLDSEQHGLDSLDCEKQQILRELKLLHDMERRKKAESGRRKEIDVLRQQLMEKRAKLNIVLETGIDYGSDGGRSECSDDSPPQDFGRGEPSPRHVTASARRPSSTDSETSDTPSLEATITSKSGLQQQPPTSDKKKRKKKKKKTVSFGNGESVLPSQEDTNVGDASHTKLLVNLTKQLEDLAHLIGDLQQQKSR